MLWTTGWPRWQGFVMVTANFWPYLISVSFFGSVAAPGTMALIMCSCVVSQVLEMGSTFLLRTGSGTSLASSVRAAPCHWWAPASSPTAARFCAQTATVMTDQRVLQLHLHHLHQVPQTLLTPAERKTLKPQPCTWTLQYNSLIHSQSQCGADISSAFSTLKCLNYVEMSFMYVYNLVFICFTSSTEETNWNL